MKLIETAVLSAVIVAAALSGLIGTSLWSHARSDRLLARLEMAHHQALLVTRLEADIAALGAAESVTRPTIDKAVTAGIRDYLASIENERAVIDADDESQAYQARELTIARRLAATVHGSADRPAWFEARRLSHQIAVRESREAQAAAAAIVHAQARIWSVTWVVAAFIMAMFCCLAIGLWRGIVAPVTALVEGTGRVATEQAPTHIRPTGLSELRDLTERFNRMASAIEEQVAWRTVALERANRELTDIDGRRRLFLSKVSHELRTPVTVLRGEAEVALRRPTDGAGMREALDHIRDNSVFLQRRLDDLLALARAEDGALTLACDRFDLGDVVRSAHAAAAPFARSSGIELRLNCAAGPVPMIGDPERMGQALVAVIDNVLGREAMARFGQQISMRRQ